jgi:hypothetical protein
MRDRLITAIPVLAFILFISGSALAQAKFDPHDLTGYWIGPPPGQRPKEDFRAPFTPAGMEAQRKRMPIYISKGPKDSGENPGCRNATCSNDPIYSCNPVGFPRHVFEENEPIEFIHTQGRILQLFQWGRTLRELWMDGRKLPSGETLDNLGPNWYGHSVAEWEGDTLVVKSTGFEPRAWPDQYGHPLSFDAMIEERYKLVDANRLEGRMTLTDLKNYTAPWPTQVRVFTRLKPEETTFFGWKGLFSGATDAMCAPMNEVDDFNKRIRDKAIFGEKK